MVMSLSLSLAFYTSDELYCLAASAEFLESRAVVESSSMEESKPYILVSDYYALESLFSAVSAEISAAEA